MFAGSEKVCFVETESREYINIAYAVRLSSTIVKENDPEGSGRIIAEMQDGYTVRLAKFPNREAADVGLMLLMRQVERKTKVIPLSYYRGRMLPTGDSAVQVRI